MTPLPIPSFPSASLAAWQQQVRTELKDERADEQLQWASPEGFTVAPYYTVDSVAQLPLADLQGAQRTNPGWLNTPDYRIDDARTANAALVQALASGADALLLDLPGPVEVPMLTRLLNGIKLSDHPVFFRTATPDQLVVALASVAPYQWRGGLLHDPIAEAIGQGRTEAIDWTPVQTAVRQTAGSPQFRAVCASSHVFHNAGATATQELALLLAGLVTQYDGLTEAGVPIAELVASTALSVSVGTSYFLEMAKLRALRVLWQRLISCYGLEAPAAFVHAQTSRFYAARATVNTNLLRATTEAMAAVMGGADALTVQPFDTVLTAPSAFSERLARNVSVLLRDESYLDKVADPAAGSYYIEHLTNELVDRAWTMLQTIEAAGGLLPAVASGWVTEQLDASWKAKVEAVRNGQVLVGVTKFRHDESELAPAPAQPDALLPDRRLAALFE